MDNFEYLDQIEDKFVNSILESGDNLQYPFIVIKKDNLLEILRYLKESSDLKFEMLHFITASDMIDYIEIIYLLESFLIKTKIYIKVELSDNNIESISPLWGDSEYLEREIFEMFGVNFNNHPNLKNFITPDNWVGYPLLKNYKYPKNYENIELYRYNPVYKEEIEEKKEKKVKKEKRKRVKIKKDEKIDKTEEKIDDKIEDSSEEKVKTVKKSRKERKVRKPRVKKQDIIEKDNSEVIEKNGNIEILDQEDKKLEEKIDDSFEEKVKKTGKTRKERRVKKPRVKKKGKTE